MAKIVRIIGVTAIALLLCVTSGVIGDDEDYLTADAETNSFMDEELLLTRKEKSAFDKLKAAVYPNITDEWKDYLKQDLFMLRWIRAKDLDVDVAIQDMFEFLDFLKMNRMDKIRDEDFSDIAQDFPTYLTRDRQGRPVMYYSASAWNVRRGILQGKRVRLTRYTYKISFQLMDELIAINKKEPNVTQGMIVMNMDGFNVFQHSCPSCISLYINLLENYERFLPGYVKEVIVINATQSYLALLEVLKTVLSRSTRKSLHVFGTNKNKWKPYLDERIDPKHLPWEFGGNKKSERLTRL